MNCVTNADQNLSANIYGHRVAVIHTTASGAKRVRVGTIVLISPRVVILRRPNGRLLVIPGSRVTAIIRL
ncbi:hypothetical protein [Marininema halotolerans]|uniref:Uncharacterized protein n=1 Tax=Marininema halotolerans TaxID=1155944 RepID=A0A1I6R9C8_9BACL|nr:hypothetical protein [Marininema halotolerans]SFS61357.1 hypothetical protein SAMN05444972_104304 [Marininema halotolerans]